MTLSNQPIRGIPLRQPRQHRSTTRRIAPIAHQITDDGEQTHDLHAGARHAVVGDVADEWGRGAGGFDVGSDAVALCAQGEGEESGALV